MENKKKCLVTQDIIGAVNWMLTAPPSIIKPEKGGDGVLTWKEKAIKDLSDKLNRVRGDFPEAAQRGVTFEKVLYNAISKNKSGSTHFNYMMEKLQGCEFQKKGKMSLVVDGNDCLLYGKYDAFKPGKIIDVKTTQSYSSGKYLKGIQHKLYCFMAGVSDFDYLIAEWKEYPEIKAVHEEHYHVDDMGILKGEIEREISELFSTLKDLNLWDAYRNVYCLY